MSKNIGIILDSFSCISEKDAASLDLGFIPLIAEIDGEPISDGVDKDRFEMLELIANSNNLKTSLPFLSTFEKVFEQFCKKYDYVIFLPISSFLSSTYNAALTFKDTYPNLHVIDTSFVGQQMLDVAKYAKIHFEKFQDIDKLIKSIKDIESRSTTYIIPKDINYVIKGGRVSSFKKFLLSALSKINLCPYIKFDKNGTSTGGIGRGLKGSFKQILNKLADKANTKIIDIQKDYKIYNINGIDKEFNKLSHDFFAENKILFDDIKLNSSCVAIHTGPEAQSFTVMPDILKSIK